MNHHHNHQDNNNGDVLNTMVESLRGRLLAERHASRLARDKAQSFENRFVELKNKLRQETKLRDKAQRKLEFFKEKLQSFNISYLDPNHQSTENLRNNNDNDIRLSLSPSSSKISATSYDHVSNHTINPSNVDLKNDHNRVSSLSTKASSVMKEKEDNDVDYSLALVPLNVTLVSTNNNNNNNERAVHESVIEVLDALRRAKEGLVCAMMATTKPIIKVGPTYNLEDTNNDKAKLFMY